MKRIMKILGIVIIVILFLVFIFLMFIRYKLNNVTDNKDLQHSLEKRVSKFLESNKTCGLIIGVYKDGKTSIMCYGVTNKDLRVKPDSSSLFELASTSKLFTTNVLQILCDKGVLSLDDKIGDILKDKIKLPQIAQNTTLRDLATHRSGFPSIPISFLAKMTDENNPYKDLIIEDLYEYLKNCKDKKEDGNYEYSNFGMGLLGHLLELKTTIKYEDLIKQELLSKLEMNQTTITLNDSLNKLLAQGYNENGKPNPIWTDNVLTGAGSFLSNGSDMIKFIRANLDSNYSSVSKSLIKTHNKQYNNEFGIGWAQPTFMDNFMGNKNIIWHNGMAGGYSSYLSIDKTTNSGLIILTNTAEDITSFGAILTRAISTQSWKN